MITFSTKTALITRVKIVVTTMFVMIAPRFSLIRLTYAIIPANKETNKSGMFDKSKSHMSFTQSFLIILNSSSIPNMTIPKIGAGSLMPVKSIILVHKNCIRMSIKKPFM